MASSASDLAYAGGGKLPTTKSREFRCGTYNARCTRGTSGTEYGHQYGCPQRSDHLPKGGSSGSTYQGDAEGSA